MILLPPNPNTERDPKVKVVLECSRNRDWLEMGCIVFSQYRETIQWLAEQLTEEFPEELIALYSGKTTSGIFLAGEWTPTTRETIKERVGNGELRLLLGIDAASEGLNLQRLDTLINLDLPWNPTRLEQRKGRIQRIGQVHDTVQIYNLRYKDSVEDRVHQLLSDRLQGIYELFGQIPDVLEDAWVKMALGEKEQAKKIIDALPKEHSFEVRYTRVEKVDWESCSTVLSAIEKRMVLGRCVITKLVRPCIARLEAKFGYNCAGSLARFALRLSFSVRHPRLKRSNGYLHNRKESRKGEFYGIRK